MYFKWEKSDSKREKKSCLTVVVDGLNDYDKSLKIDLKFMINSYLNNVLNIQFVSFTGIGRYLIGYNSKKKKMK